MRALRRGLGETAVDNASAFGFSLTISGTALIVADVKGTPDVGDAFLLIGGAVAAMIAIQALITHAFEDEGPEELPRRDQLRGSALNFLAVGAGLAAGWGVASLIGGWAGWPIAGFAAIVVYLVVEGLEYAFALHEARDD